MASASGTGNSGGRYFDWKSKGFDALILLIVGLVGAGSAIGASWLTSRSEDERAQEEFLRSERQELYAEYLTAVDNIQARLEPLVPVTQDGEAMPEAPVLSEQELLDIESSMLNIDGLWWRVRVLGSGNAITAAGHARLGLMAGFEYLYLAFCQQNTETKLQACRQVASVGGPLLTGPDYPEFSDTQQYKHALMRASRVDLGVD